MQSSNLEDNLSDSLKPAIVTPLNPRRRGIIIGASDGLGAELARRLAREGYTLALLARREELLDSLCDEINRTSNEKRAFAYPHNVAEYDKIPDLLRRIVADLGGLDLVVFLAGVNFPPGGADKYNFDNDRRMIEINLIGAMAWLNPVAEMFQSAKAGQIVGVGSVAGDRGRVGNPGYNTSKAGLATYLEALRNRLTRHGVNVLTVKPGFLKTEMLKAAQGPTPFAITPEKAAADICESHAEAQTGNLYRLHLALDHACHSTYSLVHLQKIIVLKKRLEISLQSPVSGFQTMSLPPSTFTQFENFGHSLKASSYRIRVKKAEDIFEAFQLAKKLGLKVTARGTGISYNDVSLNGGGIVLRYVRDGSDPRMGLKFGRSALRVWRHIEAVVAMRRTRWLVAARRLRHNEDHIGRLSFREYPR